MGNLNHEKWRILHTEERHRLKYPCEDVVQFVCRNFERSSNTKILDAGCGAGRHIMFLANEEIQPYGIDFSETGVEYTRELLCANGKEKYVDNIKVAACNNLPFEDEFFDGILCIGVLVYLTEEEVKQAVLEMKRCLKKNGKVFLVLRSTEDYSYNDIDDKNTNYVGVIEEPDSNKSAYCENGMSVHFFSKNEIMELFKDWDEVTIDREIKTYDNEAYSKVDYLVVARRN